MCELVRNVTLWSSVSVDFQFQPCMNERTNQQEWKDKNGDDVCYAMCTISIMIINELEAAATAFHAAKVRTWIAHFNYYEWYKYRHTVRRASFILCERHDSIVVHFESTAFLYISLKWMSFFLFVLSSFDWFSFSGSFIVCITFTVTECMCAHCAFAVVAVELIIAKAMAKVVVRWWQRRLNVMNRYAVATETRIQSNQWIKMTRARFSCIVFPYDIAILIWLWRFLLLNMKLSNSDGGGGDGCGGRSDSSTPFLICTGHYSYTSIGMSPMYLSSKCNAQALCYCVAAAVVVVVVFSCSSDFFSVVPMTIQTKWYVHDIRAVRTLCHWFLSFARSFSFCLVPTF